MIKIDDSGPDEDDDNEGLEVTKMMTLGSRYYHQWTIAARPLKCEAGLHPIPKYAFIMVTNNDV